MNQNDIEAMIQRYTEAEMAVLDGKSVTFNGQQMNCLLYTNGGADERTSGDPGGWRGV